MADSTRPHASAPAGLAENLVPRHVAIVMDGNGRWANQRGRARNAGHRAGVKAARGIVEHCARRQIEYLTLFAFSSENWQRPRTEVQLLMRLFAEALAKQVRDLHNNNVRLQFIGDRSGLSAALGEQMTTGETLTAGNTGLRLQIAVGYGGRWDIVQAARAAASAVKAGELDVEQIDEAYLGSRLMLGDLPDPDLLVRTGGEARLSNFLLWNFAYTELFFTPALWPDFDAEAMDAAIAYFAGRQRRFGRVKGSGGQVR